MNKHLSFNPIQAANAILQPKYNYMVSGRGFGKSSFFGYMLHLISSTLPGASGIIAAKTYTHLLTSILPAAFAFLERLGYIRDIHYVIGKQPPQKWGNLPYNTPVKNFSNYITFYNPERLTGFYLVSQERVGSGRGPNTDFLLTDETLRLDKTRLDNELSPTLRANKDKFKHIKWHLGEFHSTSMPLTHSGRWILDKGDYYLQEYGIDYIGLWREIVSMQLDLLDIDSPLDFKHQWNSIMRLRKKMSPRLNIAGTTLFTLSNAFDNLDFVGLSYIKEQRRRLPESIFLVEIMNMPLTLNDSPFYNINESIHFYSDGYDDDTVENLAISKNFKFTEFGSLSCKELSLKYYNPNLEIYLLFDWGGTGSFCLACQYDKPNKTFFVLKEFYALPGTEMTRKLMNDYCDFFSEHKEKKIIYIKDRYADSRTAQSRSTINEDAIKILKLQNWKVAVKQHKYKEPPMAEKWEIMQKILAEKSLNLFKVRIDAINCKYLSISIREAKVKQLGNELRKNKSLERKASIDQRTTTHFSDALDKGCYFLYKNQSSHLFVDIN